MAQMNWLAVVLAALTGFLVASLWYGPIWGRTWRRAAGVINQGINLPRPERVYAITLVFSGVAAVFVGHLLANFPGRPFHVYLMITGGIGLGFILPAFAIRSLHSRRSARLLFIDVGGWTLFYLSMGIVFAIFGAA